MKTVIMSEVFNNKSTQLLYCVVKEIANLDNLTATTTRKLISVN